MSDFFTRWHLKFRFISKILFGLKYQKVATVPFSPLHFSRSQPLDYLVLVLTSLLLIAIEAALCQLPLLLLQSLPVQQPLVAQWSQIAENRPKINSVSGCHITNFCKKNRQIYVILSSDICILVQNKLICHRHKYNKSI